MKRQKRSFDGELGIYKRIDKEVVRGEYIYTYILVKRGFYDYRSAQEKAHQLYKADKEHAYLVDEIENCRAGFRADCIGKKIFVWEIR